MIEMPFEAVLSVTVTSSWCTRRFVTRDAITRKKDWSLSGGRSRWRSDGEASRGRTSGCAATDPATAPTATGRESGSSRSSSRCFRTFRTETGRTGRGWSSTRIRNRTGSTKCLRRKPPRITNPVGSDSSECHRMSLWWSLRRDANRRPPCFSTKISSGSAESEVARGSEVAPFQLAFPCRSSAGKFSGPASLRPDHNPSRRPDLPPEAPDWSSTRRRGCPVAETSSWRMPMSWTEFSGDRQLTGFRRSGLDSWTWNKEERFLTLSL